MLILCLGTFYLGLKDFVGSLGLQATYWEPILKCAITTCCNIHESIELQYIMAIPKYSLF